MDLKREPMSTCPWLYQCPWCGSIYLDDAGYRHTVKQCQDRERKNASQVRD